MELNEVWELCLKCCNDIFDLPGSVLENKANWMIDHGFVDILNDCFFCQFAQDEYMKPESSGFMCDFCPAVQIDSKFDCTTFDYSYLSNPREFKRRLIQLNKKRVGKA